MYNLYIGWGQISHQRQIFGLDHLGTPMVRALLGSLENSSESGLDTLLKECGGPGGDGGWCAGCFGKFY